MSRELLKAQTRCRQLHDEGGKQEHPPPGQQVAHKLLFRKHFSQFPREAGWKATRGCSKETLAKLGVIFDAPAVSQGKQLPWLPVQIASKALL